MDKELAGVLNTVFGEEEKFKRFIAYLDYKEKMILDMDRNDTDVVSRWRSQGKRQLIYELRGLRDTIKTTLGK